MDLDDAWQRPDDELYEALGAELLGEAIGLGAEDEHRQFGREWFKRQQAELQRRICYDERIQGLLGTTPSDRFIDAVAAYEILRQHQDYAVSGVLLAVLLARIGLGEFCANVPGRR